MTFSKAGIRSMVVALSLIGLGAMCNPKLTEIPLDELTPWVELKMGPCFGTCPVFNLTIYENGIATYEGRQFSEREGTYIRQLSEAEIQSVRDLLTANNYWVMEEIFSMEPADLAQSTVVLHDGKYEKTLKGKSRFPDAFVDLRDALWDIATAGDWEEKTAEGDTRTTGAPLRQTFRDQIVVHLVPGVSGYFWKEKYRQEHVRVLEQFTGQDNYYLIAYDTVAMAPQQMIEKIRADEQVVGAQFNHVATHRPSN